MEEIEDKLNKKIEILEEMNEKLLKIVKKCKCLGNKRKILKEIKEKNLLLKTFENNSIETKTKETNEEITDTTVSTAPEVDEKVVKSETKRKRIWDQTKCVCTWPGCDRTFPTNNKLACHLRVHTGEQPYVCDWPDCHKRFHIKGSLKLHQNLHLRLKSFFCEFDECFESFSRIEQKDKHVFESHTGQMPYACDWPGCEYQTCYRQRLILHKRKHTGEKPYKCEWPDCEWSFSEAHHLKAHQRKHTGEKPFECLNCEKKYKNRQALRFHQKKQHFESIQIIE